MISDALMRKAHDWRLSSELIIPSRKLALNLQWNDSPAYEGHGWMGSAKASKGFYLSAPRTYPSDVRSEGVLGRWPGVIVSGKDEYHIVLHVWSKNGSFGGALDSPDQKAYGLGVSALRLDGNKLSFDVPGVNGVSKGRSTTRQYMGLANKV